MAAKLFIIFTLLSSLHFISQVSSDSKSNGDSSHVSQALHVFYRGERKLMHSLGLFNLSKYFSSRLLAGAGAPAPAPVPLAPAPAPGPSGHPDCSGLCKHRCSLHSRQNMCLRACGTCCVRCKCVPPGTYGNREMCGKCYTDMTTHGNKTKCP